MKFKTRIPPYIALLPVLVGVFVAADDQTVIVTVLPQIMLDMEVGPSEFDRASWTITGYLLGYVAAMPLIGRLSDAWGHRLVFVMAMIAFMVGSVAVALTSNIVYLVDTLDYDWLGATQSIDWLIATRVFQAIGAGALVPVSIAIVGDLFPSGSRGLPLGLMGASAEAGGVIGPLWGGLIIRYLDWPWVFWINLPLGFAVLLMVFLMLGPSPKYPKKVDYLGGMLITLSIATMTLGLARVDSPDMLMGGYFAGSAIGLVLFIIRQRMATDPLLPLEMFRVRAFSSSNVTHLFIGAALIIGMVTVPLMANTVLGKTPLEGGLLLVRLTAAIPVGAIVGGLACQRFDYRLPTIIGLALGGIGFWFMSGWSLASADSSMTIHLIISGLGFGLVIAPIALAATNSVPSQDRGTSAALVTAMRMIGMTLGLAALAAWGSGRYITLTSDFQSPLPLPNETSEQYQQKLQEIGQQLNDVGFTIFNDFFFVAALLCFIAIVPAVFMAWNSRKIAP